MWGEKGTEQPPYINGHEGTERGFGQAANDGNGHKKRFKKQLGEQYY